MSTVKDVRGRGRLYLVAFVALVHVVVLAWIGLSRIDPPLMAMPEQRAFEIFMTPRPTPPPAPQDASRSAGGSPAAPSRVHRAENPPPTPPELTAPLQPAPEQPLIVGASSVGADRTGAGLGGVGTGSGTGTGSGSGPGVGGAAVVDTRLLHRPTAAQIRAQTPTAHYRGVTGWAVIRCVVGLDTRLTNCRVMAETPAGQGFGRAGLQLARRYRYAPPTRNGSPVAGHEITFAADYGCPTLAATCGAP